MYYYVDHRGIIQAFRFYFTLLISKYVLAYALMDIVGLGLLLQQPRDDTINSDRVSQLANRKRNSVLLNPWHATATDAGIRTVEVSNKSITFPLVVKLTFHGAHLGRRLSRTL